MLSRSFRPNLCAGSKYWNIIFFSSFSNCWSSSVVQSVSRKFCGIYLTRSGCVKSDCISNVFIAECALSNHCIEASVCFERLYGLDILNFVGVRKDQFWFVVSAHRAIISVRALFPLPLLPIIATNPGFRGILIFSNHFSVIVALAVRRTSKFIMNLSGLFLIRFIISGSLKDIRSGSVKICLKPSKVKSAFIQQALVPTSLTSWASDVVMDGFPKTFW